LGSGAPEIGKQIAETLKIDYVDREIIAKVAQRLKLPDRQIEDKEMPPSTFWGRIEEALRHASSSGYGHPVYVPDWEIPLDSNLYIEGLKSVIKELADSQNIVIGGRGSQFILKDFPGAIHIFVVAPLEFRIRRTMESSNSNESDAKKEIDRYDGSRCEFTKRYFDAEREDPLNYDFTINTAHISFEIAASIVVDTLSKVTGK
jgi:hypothetical protein